MQKFKSFEEIVSWQKARELNKKIYLTTGSVCFRSDFDLARQMRRSSISISSNIAEGFERNSDREFAHFLFIAKASASELRSQLYLASDLNYIEEVQHRELVDDVSKISQLLGGLIKYLQKS